MARDLDTIPCGEAKPRRGIEVLTMGKLFSFKYLRRLPTTGTPMHRLGVLFVVVALAAVAGPSAAVAHTPSTSHVRLTPFDGGPDYSIPPTDCEGQLRTLDGPICTVPPTPSGALGISKNTWGEISDGLNFAAGGAGATAGYLGLIAVGAAVPTFGISAATAGTAAGIAGIVSGGLWMAASVASYLSRDPADRDFRSLFEPVFPRIPAVKLPARFASTAAALTGYLRSAARLPVLATAFVTSVNRATGAHRAHKSKWVHRQRQAAAKWARKAGNLLLGLQGKRDAIASAIKADGVSFAVNAGKRRAGQRKLQRAIPKATKLALKDMTKGTVAPALRKRLLDFKAFERTFTGHSAGDIHFPDDLRDTAAGANESNVAAVLLGYADKYGKRSHAKHHRAKHHRHATKHARAIALGAGA